MSRSRFTENKTVLSQLMKNKDNGNHGSRRGKHLFPVSRNFFFWKSRFMASVEIKIHEEKVSHFTFYGKKGRSWVTKIPFTLLGTSVTLLACGSLCTSLTSSVLYQSTHALKNGIYLLNNHLKDPCRLTSRYRNVAAGETVLARCTQQHIRDTSVSSRDSSFSKLIVLLRVF